MQTFKVPFGTSKITQRRDLPSPVHLTGVSDSETVRSVGCLDQPTYFSVVLEGFGVPTGSRLGMPVSCPHSTAAVSANLGVPS